MRDVRQIAARGGSTEEVDHRDTVGGEITILEEVCARDETAEAVTEKDDLAMVCDDVVVVQVLAEMIRKFIDRIATSELWCIKLVHPNINTIERLVLTNELWEVRLVAGIGP